MLSNPYNIDLILSSNNSDNNSNDDDNIIKNNNQNKLKQLILNMTDFQTYQLNADKKKGLNLNLNLNFTNKGRINQENYENYIKTNGLFGPLKFDSNSNIKDYMFIDSDEIIIKVLDLYESYDLIKSHNPLDPLEPLDPLKAFINKWSYDKIIFKSAIPEIYFYGKIIFKGNTISYYYITKKYYSHIDIIKKFNYTMTIQYFKKILELLDTTVANSYIFRDFNMHNLGYSLDKTKNLADIIILNYTSRTLLSQTDNYFKKLDISKCFSKKCIGPLIPYYVIDDYYSMNINWLKRLDKFYSLGLVEIILVLFFNNDNNFTKLYNFIIGPSILESQLQFHHYNKRFNNVNNLIELNQLISKINVRFCNANPIFEKYIMDIITNLLERDYTKIYYPNHILMIMLDIQNSDGEFKIKYVGKNNVYNQKDFNYTNTSTELRQKIISEDLIGGEDIGGNIGKDKINNYKSLYKKYKMKYLMLKNKN